MVFDQPDNVDTQWAISDSHPMFVILLLGVLRNYLVILSNRCTLILHTRFQGLEQVIRSLRIIIRNMPL